MLGNALSVSKEAEKADNACKKEGMRQYGAAEKWRRKTEALDDRY
jgi:hypothetical protein